MARLFLFTVFICACLQANSQQLLLLDRFNGNKVVNDSTITIFSSDQGTMELTQYFTMVNNTDKPLALFLRKTVNVMSDSTTDYFCFGVKCWPGSDTTDIADTVQPGASDYTFASHVVHVRRFDIPQPPLPPGLSSITYTIYDDSTFPEPIEASVMVIYHLSGLGISEKETFGKRYKVYPNPAGDWVTIERTHPENWSAEVKLFDSFGVLLRVKNFETMVNSIRLPVSDLPPGFYFGRIEYTEGPTESFKVLVY
jgi:hypothetical protein